jgi:hypothetical protein
MNDWTDWETKRILTLILVCGKFLMFNTELQRETNIRKSLQKEKERGVRVLVYPKG